MVPPPPLGLGLWQAIDFASGYFVVQFDNWVTIPFCGRRGRRSSLSFGAVRFRRIAGNPGCSGVGDGKERDRRGGVRSCRRTLRPNGKGLVGASPSFSQHGRGAGALQGLFASTGYGSKGGGLLLYQGPTSVMPQLLLIDAC